MNRFEKIAWFTLAVVSASILLFCVIFFSTRSSYPLNISLKVSFAAFALNAFVGLRLTIFKKKPGLENYAATDGISSRYGAEYDERDMLVQRRAFQHGFSAFWLIMVFSVMILWVFLRFISHGGNDAAQMFVSIDVDLIPMMLIPGFIILMLANSLSTIIQYRSITFGDNSDEIGAGPGRKTIAYTLAFLGCFIAFDIFLVSFTNWMFAVSFLMLISAAAHQSIRSLRYNPSGNFTKGDFSVLKIAEWMARSFFVVFYIASIAAVVMLYMESGTLTVIAPRLVVLGFGALVFILSILKHGNKHHMESRHE
ncbi:hypothetical protein ACFL2X_01125 [Candidatus Latescibacterota bacterium]